MQQSYKKKKHNKTHTKNIKLQTTPETVLMKELITLQENWNKKDNVM